MFGRKNKAEDKQNENEENANQQADAQEYSHDEDYAINYEDTPILERILHSKYFKICGGILVLLTIIINIIPFLIDGNSLKKQLEIRISQQIGSNVEIYGDVETSIFPSPNLTLKKVALQNYAPVINKKNIDSIYNIYTKELQIHFSLFSFLSDFTIKEISLINPLISIHDRNSHDLKKKDDKFDAAITELPVNRKLEEALSKQPSSFSKMIFPLDSSKGNQSDKLVRIISIENGHIDLYRSNGNKVIISEVNGDISFKNYLSVFLDFNLNNIPSNLKLKFNPHENSNNLPKKPDSMLHLSSPILNIKIDGWVEATELELTKVKIDGKADIGIFDLKSFYKNYLNSKSLVFYKIKSGIPSIIINADLKGESGEFKADNVKIVSTPINGIGTVNLSIIKEIPIVDIDLNLDYLNIDSLWSSDAIAVQEAKNSNGGDKQDAFKAIDYEVTAMKKEIIEQQQKYNNIEPKTSEQEFSDSSKIIHDEEKTEEAESEKPTNFNVIKQLKTVDLSAEIKVMNGRYMGGEINDVNAYIIVAGQGKILLMPMQLRIPGGGNLRINGAFESSLDNLKFVGQLDSQGEKLGDIFSWLNIESRNMKFDKLTRYQAYSDILLFPNTTVLSNLYLSLPETDTEIGGEIKIRNSGKYSNTISNLTINNLRIEDYFLTSERSSYLSPGSLLKKSLWLNDNISDNEINIDFNELHYKNLTLPEQSLKVRIGHGYIEVPNFRVKSDKINLSGSMVLNISGETPEFSLAIDGDKLEYNTEKREITDPITRQKTIEHYDIFDRFFFLPSLEKMSGRLSADFNNLIIDGVSMENFSFDGFIEDGAAKKSFLNCDIYGGKLQYKGFLGLKLNKVLSGTILANHIKVKPLLQDFVGINNIDGTANIASTIVAVASNKKTFLEKFDSEIKFTVAGTTIENYGLTSLMKKMFSLRKDDPELQNPETILFDKDEKTIFSKTKGVISFKEDKNHSGTIRIAASAPAINTTLSGNINALNQSANMSFNAIFLTGDRKKQTPINIATAIAGPLNSLSTNTNANQVRQYLGLEVKDNKTAEETKKDEEAIEIESFFNDDNSEFPANDNQIPEHDFRENLNQKPVTESNSEMIEMQQ